MYRRIVFHNVTAVLCQIKCAIFTHMQWRNQLQFLLQKFTEFTQNDQVNWQDDDQNAL